MLVNVETLTAFANYPPLETGSTPPLLPIRTRYADCLSAAERDDWCDETR